MEEKDIYAELSSIRNLMERSSKFISLSGLSGIMAGIYALTGAFIAYKYYFNSLQFNYTAQNYNNDEAKLWPVIMIAISVIILSLITGIWLTIKQAKKKNENFWNPVSKKLLISSFIPLLTGGLFIIILIFQGNFEIIAASCLLFYGLALVAGSAYTFTDVKWLGYCEILLGLVAALLPQYSFICWIIGFGFLHIVYGSIMHFKYNQ